jgi:ATP-dependent helicase/nuclease subunit A
MELTAKQKEAVQAERSVAVTAGAGTGKTAMLARRFVHHVVVDRMSPIEIAAVTFTEKAAAELRSRIRETLLAECGEDRAAEADAAQISTIHSLAARICRDFYNLAGIPADFRMLDEVDSETLIAEWFDEALGRMEPDVVTGLGYSWLARALREMLADPPAARQALEFDEQAFRQQIDQACEDAVVDLIGSECWQEAADLLDLHGGSEKDPIEKRRRSAITAMADILAGRNVDEALKVLKGVAVSHGTDARWPDGGLAEIRGCVIKLRDAFKTCSEARSVTFGPADSEMCRRLELLKKAFADAEGYLQRAKLKRRLLDFADLERYALEILTSADVRSHYAARWRAILVDEFQDTNPVQEKILEALAEGGARLTIVGDGKQSIYGFRRADPRVFARFRESIANDVVLDKTFRTHADLVRPMNDIFSSLLKADHQPLEASRPAGPHNGPFVEVHSFEGDDEEAGRMRSVEADFIAGEIAQILEKGLVVWDKTKKANRPARPSDIAILSRKRAPLDSYIEKLLSAGVPAVNTGGGDLLQTRSAKDMSVLLRFAADPNDDIALVAMLRSPFFAVSDRMLYMLAKKRFGRESWWQLISREHADIEREFAILEKINSLSRSVTAVRLIASADEMTGYTAVIANLEQSERRLADLDGFRSLLSRFAQLGHSDVAGADRYLKQLIISNSRVPQPSINAGNAVSLMTIHASKGLEWPIVFVPDLSADKRSDSSTVKFDAEMGAAFSVILQNADGTYEKAEPAMHTLIKRRKKSDEVSESVRILYVAMTRAQDRLYLTAGGKQKNDLAQLASGLDVARIEIVRYPPRTLAPIGRVKSKDLSSMTHVQAQILSIEPAVTNATATGIAEYSVCPKSFKFKFIDGHPGLGEGPGADAARVGTLTHTALELNIRSVDELRPLSDGADDALIAEAIRLAENFYSAGDFVQFRIGLPENEVSRTLTLDGLDIACKVDRVGDDYVLDFKTDSEMSPAGHAVQLWLYARALNKKRAVIAYLRQQRVHEYTADELHAAEAVGLQAVKGISSSVFVSTPTEAGCRRCTYSAICEERFVKSEN